MDHADAVREMSVEKYLLGELAGASRDDFEDHLFDCRECAADLKSGVVFAEGARLELSAMDAVRAHTPERKPGWLDWLLRPQWTAPALAACLALVGYLTLFRIPELTQQIAQYETPRLLNGLTLTDGALRGGEPRHVAASKNGSFLLSVDLPPQHSEYTSYLLSLYSPAGKLVWKTTVPVAGAGDTVQISVPAACTEAGENTLVVQGARGGSSSGATLDDLARHVFLLDVQN